ncbi:hypothetical protein JCM10213v2_003068 [Rhodosporidiobolus nylandii]
MLLRLPVELAERIVRFAVSQDYSFDNYTLRQNSLRSLCLVCRDLPPLARRLLGEWLKVYVAGYLALQDVRFSELDNLDITWLAQLPSLTHLAIAECALLAVPQSLAFFPGRGGDLSSVAIKPTDALIKQLASLVPDVNKADKAREWPLLLVRVRIDGSRRQDLWDHLTATRYSVRMQHIMMKPEQQAASLAFADHLSHTRAPSIALQRLYFPSNLDPVSCDSLVLPAVQACLRACASRGIVVEFDEISPWMGDSHVSRRFAAYATEQRAKKVQEEEAKAK